MEMAAGRWQSFFLLKVSIRQRAKFANGRVYLCTAATASEWEGLEAWRVSPLDERRVWGPKNTKEPAFIVTSSPLDPEFFNSCAPRRSPPSSLAEWGALVLNTPDPLLKTSITHHAFRLWSNHQLPLGTAAAPDRPARPDKPALVPLKQVPDAKSSGLSRNAHALHILAHIELNAVDLAWDTVVRFSGASKALGQQFYADFAHVADDESRHFGWCLQRLSELGFHYGDMPAHDMLVNEGQKSAANVMARLAVVPMVQEARGLDSGPRLAGRLVGWGDARSASIVNQIAEEELAHVAVGVSWFLMVCKKMDRVPDTTFKDLLRELSMELKGPFNHSAREKAGLPRSWYDSNSCLVKNKELAVCSSTSSGHVQMSQVQGTGANIHVLSCQQKEADSEEIIKQGSPKGALAEIYNRLELLVAMEKERAA